MKDIRKRLLPGVNSVNTLSSRAAEAAKRKSKEEDEIKVISYRMVKPKTEKDELHERIIRKVSYDGSGITDSKEPLNDSSRGKFKRERNVSKEKD